MLPCEVLFLIRKKLGTSKVEPYGNNFVILPYTYAQQHNFGERNEPIHSDEEEPRQPMGAFQAYRIPNPSICPKGD